jgi:hypothetical protein
MIRQIRGGEKPGSVLYRMQGIGLISPVHPGTDQAMGMIDTQTVELGQYLVESPLKKNHRRTGVPGSFILILKRIKERVIPGLSIGIGTTRRRPHDIAFEEKRLGKPCITLGKSDLEITKKIESQAMGILPQLAMLPIKQKLEQGIMGERVPKTDEQGLSSGFSPALPILLKTTQPPIEFSLGSLPKAPALATGEPTEHLVETIRLQPVSMLLAKPGKILIELG